LVDVPLGQAAFTARSPTSPVPKKPGTYAADVHVLQMFRVSQAVTTAVTDWLRSAEVVVYDPAGVVVKFAVPGVELVNAPLDTADGEPFR
jgi:hypothetical protein